MTDVGGGYGQDVAVFNCARLAALRRAFEVIDWPLLAG